MTPLSMRCIKAAFLYLALGIGLGAPFALDRALGARLRPLHAELNLWEGLVQSPLARSQRARRARNRSK